MVEEDLDKYVGYFCPLLVFFITCSSNELFAKINKD